MSPRCEVKRASCHETASLAARPGRAALRLQSPLPMDQRLTPSHRLPADRCRRCCGPAMPWSAGWSATLVPPLTLNFLRWALAFAAAAAACGLGAARAAARLWPHWRRFAVLGLLGVGCYNALQYLALKTSTPLNVTLVAASTPVWMLGIGALFFGQRVDAAPDGGRGAVDRRRAGGAAAAATGSCCCRCGWCRATSTCCWPPPPGRSTAGC